MIRVLVVDDDSDIRQLMAMVLQDEGYEVTEASDGKIALELIANNHPNLILLDMKMPVMDGWQFMQHYRGLYGQRASIIVVTAARDAARRQAEVSADGYLSKPFDLGELIKKVSAYTRPSSPLN